MEWDAEKMIRGLYEPQSRQRYRILGMKPIGANIFTWAVFCVKEPPDYH
jgi:hypothetical protein